MTLDRRWPAEIAALRAFKQLGWSLWGFGYRAAPVAVAALRRTQFTADVMVVRGVDDLAAYRAVSTPHMNPWAVDIVLWDIAGDTATVRQAVLSLNSDSFLRAPKIIDDACRVPRLSAWELILPPRE